MLEVQTSRSNATEANRLDFLVGLTESAAYEIAQEHGFIVRIVQRDDNYFVVTSDLKFDRANFVVVNNLVSSVSIG